MAELVTPLLVRLGIGLIKGTGAYVFEKKYGDNFIYKNTVGLQEVNLSAISMQRVIDGVASVVSQDISNQLSAQTISQAQNQLNGIQKYLTSIYPKLGGSNSERDREISQYETRLCVDVLPVLSSGDNAVKLSCLPIWLIAAAIHLAILQERANLMSTVKGRTESLKEQAKEYYQYAEETYRNGYQMRQDQIGLIKEKRSFSSRMGQHFLGSGLVKFVDENNIEEGSYTILCEYFQNEQDRYTRVNEAVKRRAQDLYVRRVQAEFRHAVSREAMLMTTDMWDAIAAPKLLTAPGPQFAEKLSLRLTDVSLEIFPEDKTCGHKQMNDPGTGHTVTSLRYHPHATTCLGFEDPNDNYMEYSSKHNDSVVEKGQPPLPVWGWVDPKATVVRNQSLWIDLEQSKGQKKRGDGGNTVQGNIQIEFMIKSENSKKRAQFFTVKFPATLCYKAIMGKLLANDGGLVTVKAAIGNATLQFKVANPN